MQSSGSHPHHKRKEEILYLLVHNLTRVTMPDRTTYLPIAERQRVNSEHCNQNPSETILGLGTKYLLPKDIHSHKHGRIYIIPLLNICIKHNYPSCYISTITQKWEKERTFWLEFIFLNASEYCVKENKYKRQTPGTISKVQN